MEKNLIGLFTILLSLLVFTSHVQGADFRKAYWGMNIANVKDSERKAKFKKKVGDTFIYTGKITGLNATIYYHFLGDNLAGGSYTFTEIYKSLNKYINDYKSLQRGLSKRYGQPTEDTELWSNKSVSYLRREWGEAIRNGHLSFFSNWRGKKTLIDLTLKKGRQGTPVMELHYTYMPGNPHENNFAKTNVKKEIKVIPITLTLPENLIRTLKKESKAEGISLSTKVLRLIRKTKK